MRVPGTACQCCRHDSSMMLNHLFSGHMVVPEECGTKFSRRDKETLLIVSDTRCCDKMAQAVPAKFTDTQYILVGHVKRVEAWSSCSRVEFRRNSLVPSCHNSVYQTQLTASLYPSRKFCSTFLGTTYVQRTNDSASWTIMSTHWPKQYWNLIAVLDAHTFISRSRPISNYRNPLIQCKNIEQWRQWLSVLVSMM